MHCSVKFASVHICARADNNYLKCRYTKQNVAIQQYIRFFTWSKQLQFATLR